jgi:hypothetical protein
MEIIVFKGDGQGNQVKILQRPLRFHRQQRGCSRRTFVFVRQEKTLAETIVTLVDQMINGLKTEIAHPLVIGVGVNQGDAIASLLP